MADTKAHSKLNASGAHRWMECPGSVPLTEDAPPEPDNPAAIEGTQAHAVLEALLRKEPVRQCSGEMLKHAQAAKRYILSRLPKGADLLIEEKVDSSFFTAPGNFGTLDAAIVDLWDRLIVIDYKYGAGHVVEADGDDGKGNVQLSYYALALAKKYEFAFSEVELIVIQPRAHHDSGETIRSYSMPMDDLHRHESRFMDAAKDVARAEKAYKKKEDFEKFLHPGSYCKWCKAAAICPEITAKPIQKMGAVISPAMAVSLPPIDRIDPKKLGALLDAGDKIELYIKKLREYAFNTLKAGGSVEGYKLVERRAHRKWKDGAEKELRDWLGDEAFEEPSPLSPSALEKKFKKNLDVKEFLKHNTEKKSSGSTLAKAGDKRQAISRSVVDDFGVIDVE